MSADAPPTLPGLPGHQIHPTLADYQERLDARANHVRESWVKAMELRLVEEELNKCQRNEGVNHYVVCGPFAQRYLDMLRDHKVTGYTVVEPRK